MRYKLPLLLLIASLAGALHSCATGPGEDGWPEGEGIPVTITVESGSRADNDPAESGVHYGSGIDSRIETIRVLGYRVSDGKLAFNKTVLVDNIASEPDRGYIYGEVEVLTGRFDFVFIANELSDAGLSALLSDDGKVATLGMLRELSFADGAFDEQTSIPMVTLVENVLVLGDNNVTLSDGTVIEDIWNVAMERLAIRVELELTMSPEFAAGAQLTFDNVPEKVYLLQDENITAKGPKDKTACLFDTEDNPDGTKTLTWERIILPESWFVEKTKQENGVIVRLTNGSDTKKATLGIHPGSDYTMPRNFYYHVHGTVQDNSAEIDMSIEVKGWSTVDGDPIDDENLLLNVSAVKAKINQRNMARIYFSTDQTAERVTVEPKEDRDKIFQGLTDGTDYNFNFDQNTGQGWFDIMTEEAAGASDGIYTIYLKSGNVKRAIEVDVALLQIGEVTEYHNYVGAFWRAAQTGERVIIMPNTGAWTATVEYADGAETGWAALSPKKTLDPGFWSDNPGEAENYPVEGNLSQLSGTGNIYFRVGCTSKNTGASPRYAVIRLTCSDGAETMNIYLRQGEQDDYLMRPGDPAGENTDPSWAGSQTRPLAAKYSPYNLTSQEYIDGTNTGGTNTTDHSQVGVRGGVFTKYPTQGGAHFEWVNETYLRFAWHPTNPTGAITGWQNNYPNTYWDALKATHETCPMGYRRPTDGSTFAAIFSPEIADSELRQSLWLNPQPRTISNLDNSLWGYLADGFFDRHYIQNSNTSYANTAVRPNSADVGYIGRLFYNSNNNASLFIPASGYRGTITSQLNSTGNYGYYWSASSNIASESWSLVVSQSFANQGNRTRSSGYQIRCVVDE